MTKNLFSAAIVLLISLAMIACGGESADAPSAEPEAESAERSFEPPSKEEAAEIIQKAPDYSDFQFTSVTLSIPMQESMMHEQMRSYAADLERAGWLRVDSTGTVVLADKARRDNRWVERSNGFTDVAPLASKEFVEVTEVERVDGDTVEATFAFRWNQNSSGAAIQSGPMRERLDSVHYGQATMENYGNGWQLFIIRPTEAPAVESAPVDAATDTAAQ